MMNRVAEFAPASGAIGALYLETGFSGWTYYFSPTGAVQDKCVVESSWVFAHDVAGNLAWERERAPISFQGHRAQMAHLLAADLKVREEFSGRSSRWVADPANWLALPVFLVVAGIGWWPIAAATASILATSFYARSVRRIEAGELSAPAEYLGQLKWLRTAGVVLSCILAAIPLLFVVAIVAFSIADAARLG